MRKQDRHPKEKVTARRLAIQCLTSWHKDKKALQPHIESVIYSSGLAPNDKQLAVMLIQGVLRHLHYLDEIISRFSRFPLDKMKPLTRMALRVGVFQLLYLNRIPPSAAVNETVKVLQAERQPRWLINFVNGVLRSVAREKATLTASGEHGADGSYIFNHPVWLVERWQKTFGPDKTRRICTVNNREPVVVLRVNTLLTTGDKLTARLQDRGCVVRPGSYAPESLILESLNGPVASLPGYAEGLFHVQDEAAQLVTMLLVPFAENTRNLDACAGLGGKSCHLAQLIAPGSELIALEPNPHRFRILGQNLQRLHLENKVRRIQARLEDFVRQNPEPFHRILVDAPCSGTGVVGRHPDIRWNRKPEDLPVYQRQQLELLAQAASLLLPGGVLVYATCSMEPEENQEVVASFLRTHPDFIITGSEACLPEPASDLVDSEGFFCPTPAEGLDGFFAVRLVRRSD